MKPIKGMEWVVKIELENGDVIEETTEHHIGQFIDFLKRSYVPNIYKSKIKCIIERFQRDKFCK